MVWLTILTLIQPLCALFLLLPFTGWSNIDGLWSDTDDSLGNNNQAYQKPQPPSCPAPSPGKGGLDNAIGENLGNNGPLDRMSNERCLDAKNSQQGQK